jgi:hypothetical protein
VICNGPSRLFSRTIVASKTAICQKSNGSETAWKFRKRVYAKLSISSKGELFAQCAGLAM